MARKYIRTYFRKGVMLVTVTVYVPSAISTPRGLYITVHVPQNTNTDIKMNILINSIQI